ncbi:hypothetical protein PV328_010453 [Microctonus aethiopoides]|uniref:Uncharacterized protein n=1 Tax=Microctonus aethiopoides TaxID=144406 RepID=A0AA39FHR2_9HYME|nr:hypothetical protein PV328_010453 [Microctonus aethiopoides]
MWKNYLTMIRNRFLCPKNAKTASDLLTEIFLKNWDDIDQSIFQSGMIDKIVANVLTKEKHSLIFITNYLQISHLRYDYEELLELSMIFLDDTSNQIIHFKRPGGMRHTRWMVKTIYSLKMFLFRGEFRLTARETINLREIYIFVILFHIKVAPTRELSYHSHHSWYISEELTALSLFYENFPVEIEKQMINAMKSQRVTIIIEK